jgi:hypothetical protein
VVGSDRAPAPCPLVRRDRRRAAGGRRVPVSKEPDDPSEHSTEVTLSDDGDETALTVEQRGLPLELLWAYAAGLQLHVEDLAAHIAGGGRGDAKARFAALKPLYQDLAADIRA